MEENTDLVQGQDVIKSIPNNVSWFNEHAYRWPSDATRKESLRIQPQNRPQPIAP